MDTFVAALFDSEEDAFRVVEAMRELQADSSIVIYGGAILTKDANGEVRMQDAVKSGPRGWAIGVIAGGLLGLLAGPAAVAAGAAATLGGAAAAGAAAGSVTGGVFGVTSDLLDAGLDAEILDIVSTEMRPGRTALVASIDEQSPIALDRIVAGIEGGKIFRQARIDVIDDKLEREAMGLQGRDQEFEVAFDEANAVEKDIVAAQRNAFRNDVAALKSRIAERQKQLEAEFADRRAALDEQIERLNGDARVTFQERKAMLLAEHDRRLAILGQAEALAGKALPD